MVGERNLVLFPRLVVGAAIEMQPREVEARLVAARVGLEVKLELARGPGEVALLEEDLAENVVGSPLGDERRVAFEQADGLVEPTPRAQELAQQIDRVRVVGQKLEGSAVVTLGGLVLPGVGERFGEVAVGFGVVGAELQGELEIGPGGGDAVVVRGDERAVQVRVRVVGPEADGFVEGRARPGEIRAELVQAATALEGGVGLRVRGGRDGDGPCDESEGHV